MSEVLRHAARRGAETKERIALGIAAGFRLPMSGSIVTLLVHLLLLLVSMAGANQGTAQSASCVSGIMLQSGIGEEGVDGDLKAAKSISREDRLRCTGAVGGSCQGAPSTCRVRREVGQAGEADV